MCLLRGNDFLFQLGGGMLGNLSKPKENTEFPLFYPPSLTSHLELSSPVFLSFSLVSSLSVNGRIELDSKC